MQLRMCFYFNRILRNRVSTIFIRLGKRHSNRGKDIKICEIGCIADYPAEVTDFAITNVERMAESTKEEVIYTEGLFIAHYMTERERRRQLKFIRKRVYLKSCKLASRVYKGGKIGILSPHIYRLNIHTKFFRRRIK